jgi:hypothetical protein
MKPYTTDKHIGKKKFDKKKINKKNGIVSSTETSALEAKNANRSRKKSKRQEVKKAIKNIQERNVVQPHDFNSIDELNGY